MNTKQVNVIKEIQIIECIEHRTCKANEIYGTVITNSTKGKGRSHRINRTQTIGRTNGTYVVLTKQVKQIKHREQMKLQESVEQAQLMEDVDEVELSGLLHR